MSGKVYLVGAGPGDPSLLTLKGARLLASADVIILDALVDRRILAHANPSARVIDAGKRAGSTTLSQDEINDRLVSEAKRGQRVVRLKGGDPFVFGRGGEEALVLRQNGVDFEVVPGISSAIAGPAYAGIPVTHRGMASSVILVTGHESDDSAGTDWEFLAKSRGTIVFLMGLSNLEAIVAKLREHGCSSETRVAVISHATTPSQRVASGDLTNILDRVHEVGLKAPALIVVGEVVGLREFTQWFESKPLFGRTVVVTRAREQASELAERLQDAGANAVEFPMIEILPPEDWSSLDHLIESLPTYRFLVLTSANAVRFLLDRLFALGQDARSLRGPRIAAVGAATATELKKFGVIPDLVPKKFQSTALLWLLPEELSDVRIGLVRAAAGREELLEALRGRGAEVDLAIAYRTEPAENQGAELHELMGRHGIDAITFTSSSTVENLFTRLSENEKTYVRSSVCLASIGPTTSATLRGLGADAVLEARNATVEGLCSALIEHFRRK